MFKVHPDIPAELSESARNFILRCFEPDPDKRATAAQLLEDPFITEYVMGPTLTSGPPQHSFLRTLSLLSDGPDPDKRATAAQLLEDSSVTNFYIKAEGRVHQAIDDND
jgi:serine/threonine protein kinase